MKNSSNGSVSRDAVKVKITIGQYGGRTSSDEISNEAAVKHNADADSISTSLRILTKEDKKKISGVVGKARGVIEGYTRFYDDIWKLLPISYYADCTKELAVVEREFNDMVSEMAGRIDDIKADARKRLGDLIDESDLPANANDFRSRFRWVFRVEQITDPNDINLNLPKADLEKIREQVREENAARMRESQAVMIEWAAGILKPLMEALKGKDKVLKKRTFEKCEQQADWMEQANIEHDPEIQKLCDRLRKIGKVDPETVKESKAVKKEVTEEGDSILEDLANFGKGKL